MKHIRTLIVSISLFVLFSVCVQTAAQVKPFNYRDDIQPVPTSILLTVTADKLEIIRDKAGYELVKMDNFGFMTQPRRPMLPMKILNIAVPPNVDWKSLKLETTIEASEPLLGKHRIKPVPMLRPVANEPVATPQELVERVSECDTTVYGANAVFPKQSVTVAAQSQMRKWRFVLLAFVPIRYNPVEGSLVLIKSVHVKLTMTRIGVYLFRSDPMLRDRIMNDFAEKRFSNFQEAKSWYEPMPPVPLPASGIDYVILTTKAIRTGSQILANFITHKQNLGHSVRVVTEDDYGALTGQAPNGTAEKIRQWLIDNYISLGIQWLLLVGNPDPAVGDVPMKMTWPRLQTAEAYKECPTDYFYADLTGNWDLDGDDKYGELHSNHPDFGIGGVDYTPEIYVGRIPVYNSDYTTLDRILNKIIIYESASNIPHWRKHVLFGMAHLKIESSVGDNDWNLGESIINNFGTRLGFGHYRHYEENTPVSSEASPVLGNPPTFPPHPPDVSPGAPDNMLKEWANNSSNEGYGIVVWSTHGWRDYAKGLLNYLDCAHLNDNKPAFVFQGSCLNGYPEADNNLGYSLLKQGAIGTVSASRVSYTHPFETSSHEYDCSNGNLAYQFVQRLINGEPVGRALYDTKSRGIFIDQTVTLEGQGMGWMELLDFNLYGDPSSALLYPYKVADVDLIPVLDHSGSMSGYTSATRVDSKIAVLRDATRQLVDLMEANGANQFGLIQFSTTADTLSRLQPLTTTTRAAAHVIIEGINPTNLTSIGDGLKHAVTEFSAHAGVGHRKVILLVTDGMENTEPMISTVQPSIIANNITVFPLGLGYSNTVNEAKLIDLANATGGDYRITDDDLILKKYFIEILGSATDWSVVTDPIYNLEPGQSSSVTVPITPSDSSVIFTAYWAGYDNAVNLTLQAPDGQIYNSTSSTCIKAKRYTIYRIDLRQLPLTQRSGQWLIKFQANNAVLENNRIRLAITALAKSGVRIRASLDKSAIFTGEQTHVKIRLSNDGQPVTGASITAFYEKPRVGFGTLMHDHPVPVSKLYQSRDQRDPVQLKAAFLRRTLREKFMPKVTGKFTLFDDGTHGDDKANDGVYTSVIPDTQIPGMYALRFVATNVKVSDTKTTREWTKYLHVFVASDPMMSKLSINPLPKVQVGYPYNLKILPRDQFGNYLGPGHKLAVAISPATKTIPLKDNIDGSYSGRVLLTSDEIAREVKLDILIDGKIFITTKPQTR